MPAAYRPAPLEGTTPLRLFFELDSKILKAGAADGPLDHRLVVDQSDGLYATVRTAAGEDQGELGLGRHGLERDRRDCSQLGLRRFGLGVQLRLGPLCLTLGGNQCLETAGLVVDELEETALLDILPASVSTARPRTRLAAPCRSRFRTRA